MNSWKLQWAFIRILTVCLSNGSYQDSEVRQVYVIQCRFCFEKCKVFCLLYLLVNLQEGYSTVFCCTKGSWLHSQIHVSIVVVIIIIVFVIIHVAALAILVARLLELDPSADFLSISCFYLGSSLILCFATLASFLLRSLSSAMLIFRGSRWSAKNHLFSSILRTCSVC